MYININFIDNKVKMRQSHTFYLEKYTLRELGSFSQTGFVVGGPTTNLLLTYTMAVCL